MQTRIPIFEAEHLPVPTRPENSVPYAPSLNTSEWPATDGGLRADLQSENFRPVFDTEHPPISERPEGSIPYPPFFARAELPNLDGGSVNSSADYSEPKEEAPFRSTYGPLGLQNRPPISANSNGQEAHPLSASQPEDEARFFAEPIQMSFNGERLPDLPATRVASSKINEQPLQDWFYSQYLRQNSAFGEQSAATPSEFGEKRKFKLLLMPYGNSAAKKSARRPAVTLVW